MWSSPTPAVVSVLDTATNALLTDIPVGAGVVMAAVTPDGSRVYVTQQAGNTVSVIDAATNAVTDVITVGAGRPAWGSHPTGPAPMWRVSTRGRCS